MTIKEGEAILDIETKEIVSKDLPVFYNTRMRLNRDLCLVVLKASGKHEMNICLPLAGSGVRAVRLLKELPQQAIAKIHINDNSAEAITTIHKHLALNDLSQDPRITITCDDASHMLLGQEGFDYIDLDPFGSPNQFLDATLRRLSRDAIVAVTATDTASLAGRYRQVCERKYWARSLNCALKHEIGLRILIRRVQLIAMEQERAMIPLFTYHKEHYYRLYLRCKRSRTLAQQLYDDLNWYLYYNTQTGAYEVTREYREETATMKRTGPMYGGKLHDNEFLEAMKQHSAKHTKWFGELQADNDIDVVGFYDTHEISQLGKVPIRPTQEVVAALHEQGFAAVQSTINPTGVKTDAPFEQVRTLLLKKRT